MTTTTEKLAQALGHAKAGLLWYQDRYPEATDGSDDEAMALIDEALAAHSAAQVQASEDELPPLPSKLAEAISAYWELAYEEGATSNSYGDAANKALADIHDAVRGYARQARAGRASAQAAQTADDLREPKNGAAWRVEWWNESARLMLPSEARLSSFGSYRNGTLMFTIKTTAAPKGD